MSEKKDTQHRQGCWIDPALNAHLTEAPAEPEERDPPETWAWVRRRCPRCGSKDVARILYGLLHDSPELDQKLAKKAVHRGGCCSCSRSPGWYCNSCMYPFGRRRRRIFAANDALRRLLEGNLRYRAAEQNPARLTELIRKSTAEDGQQPYAAIISCADSRVPVEHIFGAGIGDLFVIRNAGNVVSPTALASVEYAVEYLRVPLVMVLGHRGCGAVAAALKPHGKEPEALGALVAAVRENIGSAEDQAGAELANLKSGLLRLYESPLLSAAVADDQVTLVGAMYDIRTGAVTMHYGAAL